MNTSMTCLCGTTHTFAANEFLAQCTGCSLLLWRTEEPGDAPAAAVDALYGAEAPALSDVAAVEHHAARVGDRTVPQFFVGFKHLHAKQQVIRAQAAGDELERVGHFLEAALGG